MSKQWIEIGSVDDIPRQGARTVDSALGDIAVFRTLDDSIFALVDRCPHKNGPLSQGIVHGKNVSCPLHNWTIGLNDGEAHAPDKGCAHTVDVRVAGGRIELLLPLKQAAA